MAPLGYDSTASRGLGGSHVAYTDNIYSLFVNPAALQWANERMVFDFTVGFVGPIDKLVKSETQKSIKDIMKSFGDKDTGSMTRAFTGLTGIVEGGKLPLGFDLRGPFSFGYTANGLGIGLFSHLTLDTRLIGTDVDATVYYDFTLPIGMSFNIVKLKDHELSAGLVLKPFGRVFVTQEMSALDFMDFDMDKLDLRMPVIAGGGADLGLMYRFKKDLVLGLTAKDVYTVGYKVYDVADALDIGSGSSTSSTTDTTYRIPMALNAGFAYTFRPANSLYIALMADWGNLQNVFTWDDRAHRNPLLDIGAGLELGLFNFLKFRAGIHEMLPSVGFGLEPAVFKLNLALYGKELGGEPGVNSTMGAELSITFRPDTKKKNWVWSKPLVK
jgi:hypothetical protein